MPELRPASRIATPIVAQRAAASLDTPFKKTRQRLNELNVRGADAPKTAVSPSTARLNDPRLADLFNQPVESLDTVLAALADPTRRAMLEMLMTGERTVGALAAPHAMSFAGAAKHVAVLERAGLIERHRAGRRHVCRLRQAGMRDAAVWIARFFAPPEVTG